MTDFQRGIIDLVKSALLATKADLPADFDWQAAYDLTKKHQIIPLIFYGALNSGISIPDEFKKDFETGTYTAAAISINQRYYLSKIHTAFQEKDIDYVALKGAILKELYPRHEMRQMSDADILIKPSQYDAIKSVMLKLGFEEKYQSDHELVWAKNGFLNVELHKRLIPSYNKDYYKYFGDGWTLCNKTDTSRHEMSNEDNFIYIFTHFAKHYRDGGIGIRHLVDFKVLLQAYSLDFGYIEDELKKLKLLEFYKNIIKTLEVWFNNAESEYEAELITKRIFESDSYGNYENSVLSDAVKLSETKNTNGSIKAAKAFQLVFWPYKNMCVKYPVLVKAPFLLPLMWAVRVFSAIFNKKKKDAYLNELKVLTDEGVDTYKKSLYDVGLRFDFKE